MHRDLINKKLLSLKCFFEVNFASIFGAFPNSFSRVEAKNGFIFFQPFLVSKFRSSDLLMVVS